ncbi:MAG: hypothetical protein Q7S33_05120 [Nanoarchaeota archaeon]|nr:hypothetical protein [Nanoarchaeota archaeon]
MAIGGYGDITGVLNAWEQMGVFSYVIPFLLIFALVFGILTKSNIMGENKSVNAIIALSIGLLALQFDLVSTFFGTIFPRFAVGLSIFLVLILLAGLFYSGEGKQKGAFFAIGIIIAIAVILWSLANWDTYTGNYMIGSWVYENFWTVIIGIIVVGGIAAAVKFTPAGRL